MDNNNNTPKSVDDYSEKCGLPSSQGGGTNNINHPDFNKEYGKPVTVCANYSISHCVTLTKNTVSL